MPGTDALEEISKELAEYIPLTALARRLGWNLARLHRARLTEQLECTKILGRWSTTPAAVRAMLAKSRAANVAAKQQSGMRTESARRSAADEAMLEIQALTS